MHVYLAKEGEEQALHDMLIKAKAIYGTPTSMVIKLALRRFLPYFLSGEYQQRAQKIADPTINDYNESEQRLMEVAETALRKVLVEQAAPAKGGKKGG